MLGFLDLNRRYWICSPDQLFLSIFCLHLVARFHSHFKSDRQHSVPEPWLKCLETYKMMVLHPARVLICPLPSHWFWCFSLLSHT